MTIHAPVRRMQGRRIYEMCRCGLRWPCPEAGELDLHAILAPGMPDRCECPTRDWLAGDSWDHHHDINCEIVQFVRERLEGRLR